MNKQVLSSTMLTCNIPGFDEYIYITTPVYFCVCPTNLSERLAAESGGSGSIRPKDKTKLAIQLRVSTSNRYNLPPLDPVVALSQFAKTSAVTLVRTVLS